MEHIQTVELSSSQTSITFNSISQDFDHLVILLSNRNNASVPARNLYISFNSSTANFSGISFYGRNDSYSSVSESRVIMRDPSTSSTTADTFSNTEIFISNYSGSTTKSFNVEGVGENVSVNNSWQQFHVGLWNDTSAINSVSFDYDGNGSFLTGSSAALYGISAGGSGTVTTA